MVTRQNKESTRYGRPTCALPDQVPFLETRVRAAVQRDGRGAW
jgi:hypothetical protein